MWTSKQNFRASLNSTVASRFKAPQNHSMSQRFLTTPHSWQASCKTRLLAQPFARHHGTRNESSTFCRKCEYSNSARGPARRRSGTQQTPKIATPKRSQALISGPQKPAAYEPLTDKLALRASPTLLYRASSYTNNFRFGCYAVGSGLLAAGTEISEPFLF